MSRLLTVLIFGCWEFVTWYPLSPLALPREEVFTAVNAAANHCGATPLCWELFQQSVTVMTPGCQEHCLHWRRHSAMVSCQRLLSLQQQQHGDLLHWLSLLFLAPAPRVSWLGSLLSTSSSVAQLWMILAADQSELCRRNSSPGNLDAMIPSEYFTWGRVDPVCVHCCLMLNGLQFAQCPSHLAVWQW